ncbi:conserved hypothetical protein [Leishmania mexicana MHOM/GT/2001/U1103]|uniref:GAF domain-containing protein n=1 Tax=Leishmania mexicana (strain MHOM/GT/2001/U1103) TaxID=929439 RepID=E9B5K0_LEIMU|nr:conserved hypothetical protein [Leishmania mexicana MHOM/GT/2001/U1103]CBZ30520.1 conserved hypothetical protein [Leishmania mexicana MHOM/GT/2001/U1103]
MDSTVSLSAASDCADPLLTRLQDSYTRQKRQLAAQKRKQTDVELQTAAAHCSDLPLTLELLSDGTASLFDELERLLEARHEQWNTPSREVALLQHIRLQTNREMRECMSFIEEGYRSGFEKLLRESCLEKRNEALPKTPVSSSLATTTLKNVQSAKAASVASSVTPAEAPSHLSLREALSESISLMAESLAVLLQCEVVRVYLYDSNAHLKCVAQFPYRAQHADPMHSSYLALMAVREVHHIVCQERLVINGWLSKSHSANDGSAAAADNVGSSAAASGLEDIRTCLLLPIFSPEGVGKPYGLVHAVNKQYPTALGVATDESTEVAHVGFNADDETLASSVARVLGTMLRRYPAELFFAAGTGEKLRRRAFPGDAEVLSLTAHLPPILQDEVQDAAEVAQLALSHLTPVLVHRVPMTVIYEARSAAGEGRRRKLAVLGPRESAVSSVEFNLRCLKELWESSRDDNVTLHKQCRTLEEQVQDMRLLLRNVLDGVAVARAMPLRTDVAQFLHNLEMYGRTERTERMAEYVSEQMLAIPDTTARAPGAAHTRARASNVEVDTKATQSHISGSDLRALQNHHARLNTVTPASLHFDGPSGVRSYTSDPAQKREQVRFIDELCRLAQDEKPSLPLTRRGDGRRQALPSTFPTVTRAKAERGSKSAVKEDLYPCGRPFKL